MAALLAVFHPVPPVIRRRAKELLDTIRQAVKSALSTPEAAEESSGDVETAAESMAVDQAENTQSPPQSSTSDSTPSLWSRGKGSRVHICHLILTVRVVSAITATQSTLFGPSLQRKANDILPVAQRSALFGIQSNAQTGSRGFAPNRARFLEAAMRIHSNLVIILILFYTKELRH